MAPQLPKTLFLSYLAANLTLEVLFLLTRDIYRPGPNVFYLMILARIGLTAWACSRLPSGNIYRIALLTLLSVDTLLAMLTGLFSLFGLLRLRLLALAYPYLP